MLRPSVVLAALLLVPAGAMADVGPGIEERSTAGAMPAVGDAASSDASVVLFETLQKYQAQIETLTGRVEELEHQLGTLRDEQRARYLDLDSRLNTLSLQATATSSPAAPAEPAAPAVGSAGTSDERAAYDKARGLLKEKKYADAIAAFEEQIKSFPDGELVPSAMFWLGELWLAAETPDPPKAGRYFARVYNEYPKSTFAPDAMYKAGVIQCQTGDVSKGRVTLNRLIVQQAGSKQAAQAQAALRQQCAQ